MAAPQGFSAEASDQALEHACAASRLPRSAAHVRRRGRRRSHGPHRAAGRGHRAGRSQRCWQDDVAARCWRLCCRPDSGDIGSPARPGPRGTQCVEAVTAGCRTSFGIYDTLTAREVLRFAAAAYRHRRRPLARGVRANCSTLVHLADYADRPVHVLSRGQKQRLGLARALVHDPACSSSTSRPPGSTRAAASNCAACCGGGRRRPRRRSCRVTCSPSWRQAVDRVVFVDQDGRSPSRQLPIWPGEQRRPWRCARWTAESARTAASAYGLDHSRPITSGCRGVAVRATRLPRSCSRGLSGTAIRVTTCAPVGSGLEEAYLAMTEKRR